MKKSILVILTSAFVPIVSFAQFNTIGDVVNHQTVKTKVNPSEQTVAPKDSILPSDTAFSEIPDRMEGKEERLRTYLSVSFPLKKIQVNSKFGMRKHPVYHKYMMHNGLDLHARHEDVLSMLPGKVLRVGYDSRSGKYVTVQTANYTVSYCHLSEQYVKTNDYLHAGEPLGLTGNTGASTGEHLHLTTKKDGKAFDPTILIDYVRSVKNSCLNDLAF